MAKRKAMSKAEKFPKEIYVQWYKDTDNSTWLTANETVEDAADADVGGDAPGKRIGVYVLDRTIRAETSIKVTDIK